MREPPRPFGDFAFAFCLLFAAVACELIAAALVGQRFLGEPRWQVFRIGDVTLGLSGWFLIPLAWLGLVAIALAKRKADRPTVALMRTIRLNRDWLVRGLLLSVIHIPLGRAFATFKASIPLIRPFDWDPVFADLDHLLFGRDAWLLTHALIGGWGTIAIDRVYALWGTYLVLLAGWISFTRNRPLQIKAALAFNLCWVVNGAVLATYFASAGPCFFELFHGSDRFAPLMAELAQVHDRQPLLAFRAMDYLTQNAGTAKLGVGISAMPSMHVSMAALGVILAFAARSHWAIKLLAVMFALVIFVGSIHLGWHYAVDGLASAAITVVVWSACSTFVERTRRGARP